MFRRLQHNEIVGLNVKQSWFEQASIHVGPLPEEFQSDPNVVKCLNYPNSNDPRCDDYHSNSMDMFGFVQICSQPRDDSDYDDNESIVFPSLITNEESKRRKTAYAQCIAHFKETMDWIGSVGTQQEIDKVRIFLNEITGEMKRKSTNTVDTSNYISSNSPCETMRTHHGANGRNPVKRKRY